LYDLDDDGKLEIFVPLGGLYAWKADGTLLWSYPYDGVRLFNHLSIDDLDNDGLKEIVVTCYSGGAVFVFDVQGNVRSGWPATFPPGCPTCLPAMIMTSASIGDIDNDGLKEIVVPVQGDNKAYCLKPDGSACPGFPVDTMAANSAKAVLADIDGDGHLEIIFVNEAYFHIFRYDGMPQPGFPIWGYFANSGASLHVGESGPIVGFSSAIMMDWKIFLYSLNPIGILPGWPTSTPNWFFDNVPLFADIVGTSEQEVVCGAFSSALVFDGRLYAYDMNGGLLSGFPTANLYHRGLRKPGAINDLNGDGILDICYGSENAESVVPRSSTVYCWSTGYPYNLDNVDWAMDGFDLGHTGRWRRLYHIDKMNSTLDVAGCEVGNGASSNIPLYKRGNEGDFERQMRESPILPNPSDSLFQRERGSEPKKVPPMLKNPGRITSTARLSPCYLPADGSLIPVVVTAVREHGGANPSGQDVRYSRTLGCGNYEGPVLDHGDGMYTRMLRAPTAECATDVHAWVNEFKLEDCQTIIFRIPNPKEASPTASPMTAEKGSGTSVTVHYTAGCGATTHAVYWGSGPIGAGPAWMDAACDVASGGTFDPGELSPGEWIYFVVVGQNATKESSYGKNSMDQERPEAVGIGLCDKPQDLSGTCP
jgi:hypothetical protein